MYIICIYLFFQVKNYSRVEVLRNELATKKHLPINHVGKNDSGFKYCGVTIICSKPALKEVIAQIADRSKLSIDLPVSASVMPIITSDPAKIQLVGVPLRCHVAWRVTLGNYIILFEYVKTYANRAGKTVVRASCLPRVLTTYSGCIDAYAAEFGGERERIDELEDIIRFVKLGVSKWPGLTLAHGLKSGEK